MYYNYIIILIIGDGSDLLNSEVKSPVSLVHELALKRNLSVAFTVKSERGPPHMRVSIISLLYHFSLL